VDWDREDVLDLLLNSRSVTAFIFIIVYKTQLRTAAHCRGCVKQGLSSVVHDGTPPDALHGDAGERTAAIFPDDVGLPPY
jgi:hypothetical protein